MKPGWNGKFKEGAKGRCFWCGEKEAAHRDGICSAWRMIGSEPDPKAYERQRQQSKLSRLTETGWPD